MQPAPLQPGLPLAQGRAVQVNPGFLQLTPRLLSGTFRGFQLLKLKYEKLLSDFACFGFNCKLRHYTKAEGGWNLWVMCNGIGAVEVAFMRVMKRAGQHVKVLLNSEHQHNLNTVVSSYATVGRPHRFNLTWCRG